MEYLCHSFICYRKCRFFLAEQRISVEVGGVWGGNEMPPQRLEGNTERRDLIPGATYRDLISGASYRDLIPARTAGISFPARPINAYCFRWTSAFILDPELMCLCLTIVDLPTLSRVGDQAGKFDTAKDPSSLPNHLQ